MLWALRCAKTYETLSMQKLNRWLDQQASPFAANSVYPFIAPLGVPLFARMQYQLSVLLCRYRDVPVKCCKLLPLLCGMRCSMHGPQIMLLQPELNGCLCSSRDQLRCESWRLCSAAQQ